MTMLKFKNMICSKCKNEMQFSVYGRKLTIAPIICEYQELIKKIDAEGFVCNNQDCLEFGKFVITNKFN